VLGDSCLTSFRLGEASSYWLRKWRIDGTFERLNAALGERLRELWGRNAQPPAQASRGLPVREDNRWCRRRTERIRWWEEGARYSRRHLLVDTEGLVLTKPRSTAQRSPTPRWANALLLKAASERFFHASLSHLWVDAGYPRAEAKGGQRAAQLGLSVEVVHRTPPSQYPRR
jgi:putative transposase